VPVCDERKQKREGERRNNNNVRKEIEEIEETESIDVNRIQERRLRVKEKIWRIITIYNEGKMKDKRKEIERKIEEEILCIGGDFNARIGREGKRCEEREEKMSCRNSKNRETNRKGKDLLRLLEDRGWEIANGNRGDETG